MVEGKPTSTGTASQLTPDQMRGLAARLRARADSVWMKDQPYQTADMRQAATLIEHLASLTAEIRRASIRPLISAARAPAPTARSLNPQ